MGESDLESTKMEQWGWGKVIWSLLKWSSGGGGK